LAETIFSRGCCASAADDAEIKMPCRMARANSGLPLFVHLAAQA
jgi:hypothetical protein